VQVADLPGLVRGGGWFAPTPAAPAAGPMPSAPLTSDRLTPEDRLAPAPVAMNRNARPEADHGLDGWFLDRLFGRR
jgi:hypothetical protein